MGKDVRGTEGGKCACGESEDFVRSDGATCGYCGCLPTRHSEKDARYSPTLLVVHRVREQVKVQVHRSGKMKTWGFPDPKGEYTEFSHNILPKCYLSFWTTCPYMERFRRCFVTERKRQWEVREALKAIAINHKLAFVTSDNPAAAGRFMKENFSAKRHDATTIKNNIDDLSKPQVKIELNAKVTENGDALFDSNGRDI